MAPEGNGAARAELGGAGASTGPALDGAGRPDSTRLMVLSYEELQRGRRSMAPEGALHERVTNPSQTGFNGAGARWRRKDPRPPPRRRPVRAASTGPALDGAGRSRGLTTSIIEPPPLQRGRRSMAPEGAMADVVVGAAVRALQRGRRSMAPEGASPVRRSASGVEMLQRGRRSMAPEGSRL